MNRQLFLTPKISKKNIIINHSLHPMKIFYLVSTFQNIPISLSWFCFERY